MPAFNVEALVAHVEAWEAKKREAAAEFTNNGLRRFAELMNYHTKALIQGTEKADPEFWSSLAELATNAATLTTKGAKLRVNHVDRTDV